VIGTTKAVIAGHSVIWELRRIGPGIAWCLRTGGVRHILNQLPGQGCVTSH
jgi:hypothetical protein